MAQAEGTRHWDEWINWRSCAGPYREQVYFERTESPS